MAMTINTNISALQVTNALNQNELALQNSLEKLSTGSQINTAADDPAGLAISQGLQAQIGGLNQASKNAADGIGLIQTASGALTQVSSILQTIRGLAVQSANDTESADARTDIQTEVTSLAAELTRISTATNFNGVHLLDSTGGTGGVFTLQIGSGSGTDSQITLDLTGADITSIATNESGIDLGTDAATSAAAITTIDADIASVATAQANLGASQIRLQSTQQSIAIDAQNLTAANSQIADTDMASEMANYTKENVLVQAGTAMLSQANQQDQLVLKLLQN